MTVIPESARYPLRGENQKPCVAVGSIWKSKDKREPGRRIRVRRFEDGYAICDPVVGRGLRGGRTTRIRVNTLVRRWTQL